MSLSTVTRALCACVRIPDGVVIGQVLLSKLWVRAQRKVDLQVAVLHRLGRQVALRLGHHGREQHTLLHGLLVVPVDAINPQITEHEPLEIKSLNLVLNICTGGYHCINE